MTADVYFVIYLPTLTPPVVYRRMLGDESYWISYVVYPQE